MSKGGNFMENKKKLLSVFLCGAMALSMVGCGNTDESEKKTTTKEETTTTAVTNVTTEAEATTTTVATTTAPKVTTEKPATSINEKNGEEYVLIEGSYRKLSKTNALILTCKSERLDVTFDNLNKISEDVEIVICPSSEEDYPYEELAKVVSRFKNLTLDWSGNDNLESLQYFTNATDIELNNVIVNDVSVFYNLTKLKHLEFGIGENYIVQENYKPDDWAVINGLVTTSDTYNVVPYNEELKTLSDKLKDCHIKYKYDYNYQDAKN